MYRSGDSKERAARTIQIFDGSHAKTKKFVPALIFEKLWKERVVDRVASNINGLLSNTTFAQAIIERPEHQLPTVIFTGHTFSTDRKTVNPMLSPKILPAALPQRCNWFEVMPCFYRSCCVPKQYLDVLDYTDKIC